MPDRFNKTYRYLKGIYEAKFFDAERNLQYYDNQLTDANFETSVNLGELTAGVGNPTVIQLPDTARFNVTLTAADIDLRSRWLQTGGVLGYNGITDTCELITAEDASLTVTNVPVAPYGSQLIVAYVNGDGTAYEIDPDSKTVQGFTATPGQQYAVRYYIAKAASEVLDVKSLFAPYIGTLEVKMPVFAAPVGASTLSGTQVGYWHIIVPRFQFGGTATVTGSQTTAANSSLSGQALAYNPESGITCAAATPSLLYMVYEPVAGTEGISDMVVLDGGQMSLAVDATAMIPVRYIMSDGLLAVPDYTDLNFVSETPGTASVTTAGVVTGVAAGSTEVTISHKTMTGLSAVCNVDVT